MTTKPKPSAQRKASAQRAPAESPPADAAPAPFEAPTAHEFARAVAADVGLVVPCRVCGSDRAGLQANEPCPVDGHRPEDA